MPKIKSPKELSVQEIKLSIEKVKENFPFKPMPQIQVRAQVECTMPYSFAAEEHRENQHHTEKKSRGKIFPAKKKGSDGSRDSSNISKRLDRHIVRKSRMISSGRRKTPWILLLLMMSILGVVQALTDCQIMHEWLPEMFDGTGTVCCEQSGIKCDWGSRGRITEMYVA
jgi:hypothetical protein